MEIKKQDVIGGRPFWYLEMEDQFHHKFMDLDKFKLMIIKENTSWIYVLVSEINL